MKPPVQLTEKHFPKPVGYHLLVQLPQSSEAYDSGILKAGSTRTREEVSAVYGRVIDIGDLAYKDEKKFPTGPWCEIGQYVMFRPYSGTRFKINGVEYRMMADDQVEATVEDPNGLTPV